jgi:hypothetical protein
MDWKAFMTGVLGAHGKKVSIPVGRPPKVGFVEGWMLDPGSTLIVMFGAQSYGFRADDGYTIQVEDEHMRISREKPMHEATYVFYAHLSSIKVQKADLPTDAGMDE